MNKCMLVLVKYCFFAEAWPGQEAWPGKCLLVLVKDCFLAWPGQRLGGFFIFVEVFKLVFYAPKATPQDRLVFETFTKEKTKIR